MPLIDLPKHKPKPPSTKPELSIFSFGDDHTTRISLLTALQKQYGPAPTPEPHPPEEGRIHDRSLKHQSEEKSYRHTVPANERQQRSDAVMQGAYDGAIWITSNEPQPTTDRSEPHILRILRKTNASLFIFLVDPPQTSSTNPDELKRRQDQLDLTEMMLREQCEEAGFIGDHIEIIRGDPNDEASAQALYETCDKVFFPTRQKKNTFLMPIEDVFNVHRDRIVVTGRVSRGRADVGTKLELLGLRPTKMITITAIEAFRRTKIIAEEGLNVGLMISGVVKGEVERGQVLAEPGSMQVTDRFEAEVLFYPPDVAPKYPPVIGQEFQLYLLGQSGIRCVLLAGEFISGGLSCVTIQTRQHIAIELFTTFGFRAEGRASGGGIVTKLFE
jgi:elongation factor Tu